MVSGGKGEAAGNQAPETASSRPVAGIAMAQVIRSEWGRILALLTKTLGDLQLAEDSLQDAVESALIHWERNGIPNSPAAWLMQTARRKAIDRIRRQKNFASKEPELTYLMELDATANEEDQVDGLPHAIADRRLELIFACCHPAIEEKSRIALTLRTLGGLTTTEIANAFLDKTEAMAARLTRAKKKIAAAGIPFEVPKGDALGERLNSVLNVIYLIFNEGYSASEGDQLIRHELTGEASNLIAMVEQLLPDEPECAGLHALFLLHESRSETRTDSGGNFIALEHQDRRKWDREKIVAGTGKLKAALAKGRIGPYQLQAAISACHAEALTWAETDWHQIALLYELLSTIQPNPVIRLNQLYALSHTRPLGEVLERLSGLRKSLADYQPFYAVKADILKRAGKTAEAAEAYREAIRLTENLTERQFLIEACARLEQD